MDLLLVNVPMDLGKKPYDLAFPFIKRLNFGILAIASYMKEQGYSVGIYDPQALVYADTSNESYGLNESSFITNLLTYIYDNKPSYIGLSCISGFSYPNCKEVAFKIREAYPTITIFVGGKDHVGQIANSVLEECPSIDIVVRGEGEITVTALIKYLNNGLSLNELPNLVFRDPLSHEIISTPYDSSIRPENLPKLDYSLYPNYRLFPPSLEISRGCPFSCSFCVSAKTQVRKKSIKQIIEEVIYISEIYQDNYIKLYFETPMFLMQDQEIIELAIERERQALNFTWRTETRVDYLSVHRLKRLANAGLRVLDLGLESASPEILRRMNKTQSPVTYLEKAAEILDVAREIGVIVKINILFYIGDNFKTLTETIHFLKKHVSEYHSVSAYPLLLYPGSALGSDIHKEIEKTGGSVIADSTWSERHLFPVNLSMNLTYDVLQELGTLFSKSFQTLQTFYNQKGYGYFSPGTSFDDFQLAARKFGINNLPFSESVELLEENIVKLHEKIRLISNQETNQFVLYDLKSLGDK